MDGHASELLLARCGDRMRKVQIASRERAVEVARQDALAERILAIPRGSISDEKRAELAELLFAYMVETDEAWLRLGQSIRAINDQFEAALNERGL